eukprot:Gb_24857 [translate_table: standard]
MDFRHFCAGSGSMAARVGEKEGDGSVQGRGFARDAQGKQGEQAARGTHQAKGARKTRRRGRRRAGPWCRQAKREDEKGAGKACTAGAARGEGGTKRSRVTGVVAQVLLSTLRLFFSRGYPYV